MNHENEDAEKKFFYAIVNIYMGRVKRKSFDKDDSAKKVYDYALKTAQQEGGQYNRRLTEILNQIDDLFRDPKVKNEILNNNMKISEFITKYSEQILGNNKRQYDMSNLFNAAYIKSTNNDKCENGKKIKYIPTKGNAYEFSDNNGNEFCIEEIGNLYMQKWNREQSHIEKYKITRKENGKEIKTEEIYTNINISGLDDEKYKEAIITELFSRKNIDLSNAGGYVGEVVETPEELKKESCGAEKVIGGSMYFYKINDKYSLMYDAADLSAVMLHTKYNSKTVNEIRYNDTDKTLKDDGEER